MTINDNTKLSFESIFIIDITLVAYTYF